MNDQVNELLNQYEGGQLTRRQFLAATSAFAAAPVAAQAAEKAPEISGTPTMKYEAKYLFSRRSLVRREIVGVVAEGFRINVIVEGGYIRGPALNGTCGHGGDWFVVRRDGVGIVDSRVSLHTDDGALIDTFYSGVVDLGVDAFERITKGEAPMASTIHIAARFQTSAPKYAWLNRVQAFGIGRNDPAGNLWDTYALS
jgi:hypothetical protein